MFVCGCCCREPELRDPVSELRRPQCLATGNPPHHFRFRRYGLGGRSRFNHFKKIAPEGQIPLKAPKGGHRRLPHVGKAFEEGASRKGRNPGQGKRSVPHWSNCVVECGKLNQRKAGGPPKSSLEPSKTPFLKDIQLKIIQGGGSNSDLLHFEPTWLQVGSPRPSKIQAEARKKRC